MSTVIRTRMLFAYSLRGSYSITSCSSELAATNCVSVDERWPAVRPSSDSRRRIEAALGASSATAVC